MKSFGITFMGGTMLAIGLLIVPELYGHAAKGAVMPIAAVWLGLSLATLIAGIKTKP